MRSINLTPIVAAALLQGCAYLTTFKSDLGNPDVGVSIDAKQRVVLMGPVETEEERDVLVPLGGDKNKAKPTSSADADITRPGVPAPDDGASTQTLRTVTKKHRRICAEPSPDALAVLGASFGASFFDEKRTAQIATALGESATSIGLRTTSIQLMRDAMYRACEAYLSGGISARDYADLQAHSQNLIVGLLAIEQLTGAVQAQQVSLTSNSGAGGLATSAEEEDAYKMQQIATAAAEQDMKDAEEKAKKADDAVIAKKKEIDDLKNATPPADAATLKPHEDALLGLNEKLQTAQKEKNGKAIIYRIEKEHEKFKKEALDHARTRIRSTVSGSSEFATSTKGGMSEQTAAGLATSVSNIVTQIMSMSVGTQKCINIISSDSFGKLETIQKTALISHCEKISTSESKERDAFIQRRALERAQ